MNNIENRYIKNNNIEDPDESSSDVVSVNPTIKSMDKISLIQMKKRTFS